MVIVEHLEGRPGKWILLEYRHALELAGGCLVVTNAGDHCSVIRETVGGDRCIEESVEELIRSGVVDARETVVLDPRAGRDLEPGDAAWARYVVVGGILGDHPPRGRTWVELTSRLSGFGVEARRLGEKQLSIDGAVYVALQVLSGKRLEEIELVDFPSVEVETPYGLSWEVTLPFAYPVVGGKPLFAPGLVELLRAGLGYEEARLLRENNGAEEPGGEHRGDAGEEG